MTNTSPAAKALKRKKRIERSLMAFCGFGAIALIALGIFLFQKIAIKLAPVEEIYGTWVEHNVSSHVKEVFILSQSGVYQSNRLIASKFHFDGHNLSFKIGDTVRTFIMSNPDLTEIKTISDDYYKPVYRLKERYKPRARNGR
ncbi:DUF2850 domain-containing protein [Vibrio sp.]|nr:DUF2850 domain-containing protein [Vibrio sp.]